MLTFSLEFVSNSPSDTRDDRSKDGFSALFQRQQQQQEQTKRSEIFFFGVEKEVRRGQKRETDYVSKTSKGATPPPPSPRVLRHHPHDRFSPANKPFLIFLIFLFINCGPMNNSA